MKEAERQDFLYQGKIVPGKAFEVELTNGQVIRVWRADDCQQYFCHGLTFGGKRAPGGPVSPFTGKPVEMILHGYYQQMAEADACPEDILVWTGLPPETTPHSAILTAVQLLSGKSILEDTATQLQTKNGFSPETILPLGKLIGIYGESYNVYRKH
jgi:hypothetical protein